MSVEETLTYSSGAHSGWSLAAATNGSIYQVSGIYPCMETHFLQPMGDERLSKSYFHNYSDNPLSPPKEESDMEYVERIGQCFGSLEVVKQLTPPPEAASFAKGLKKHFLERHNLDLASNAGNLIAEQTKAILPIGARPGSISKVERPESRASMYNALKSTCSISNLPNAENYNHWHYSQTNNSSSQYSHPGIYQCTPKIFMPIILQHKTEVHMIDEMPNNENKMQNVFQIRNMDVSAQKAQDDELPIPMPKTEKANTAKERKKKFECPHCHKRCSNKGQLDGHIRSHTGERPFPCDLCLHEGIKKWFTRREELTRHLRSKRHQREGGLPCDKCQKKFFRQDHLRKHQKTHEKMSGRRDCRCDIQGCEKTYTRSDALSRHKAKVHNIQARPRQLVKVHQK